jgi:hypothetical protein
MLRSKEQVSLITLRSVWAIELVVGDCDRIISKHTITLYVLFSRLVNLDKNKKSVKHAKPSEEDSKKRGLSKHHFRRKHRKY